MRWTLPWFTSRGATPKLITRPATRATAARLPRMRIVLVVMAQASSTNSKVRIPTTT